MFKFATTNYTDEQLYKVSISDESFLNQYRASLYPCFFVSIDEVMVYESIWKFCFDITDGVVPKIKDIFGSIESLEVFVKKYEVSVVLSDGFIPRVFNLISSGSFLPRVDLFHNRFIPDVLPSAAFSSSSDDALVDLSAAVSYRQSFHLGRVEGNENYRYLNFLLDRGLIVCVGEKVLDSLALIDRYASVTGRSCVQDSDVGDDFSYHVSFGDYAISLSGSMLTSFTIPQSLSVITTSSVSMLDSILSYLFCMPNNIFVEGNRLCINHKQVFILALSTKEFSSYFSDAVGDHHNLIYI